MSAAYEDVPVGAARRAPDTGRTDAVVKPSSDGQWYYVLVRGGQVVLTSETYTRRRSAVRAVRALPLPVRLTVMSRSGKRIARTYSYR